MHESILDKQRLLAIELQQTFVSSSYVIRNRLIASAVSCLRAKSRCTEQKMKRFENCHLTGPGKAFLTMLKVSGTPGSLLTGNPVVYLAISVNPRHKRLRGFFGLIILTR